MGPSWLLWTAAVAVLLLTRAASLETSRFCGHLEYWNSDKRCCSRCLQRFGPPACPDYEFTENCGLNDFGDTVAHPFKKCSPGYCNPNGTELCSQCNSGAAAPTHMKSPGRTHKQCRKKPVPPKEVCPLKPEAAGVSNSPGRWSLGPTTEEEVSSRPGFVLPSVLPLAVLPLFLVLLLILAVVLLSLFKRKVHSHPCSGLTSEDPSTSVHYWPCPDTLEVLGSRNRGKTSLLQLSSWELQGLASQPLSLLLDELEVLEELIMLLDPEPGPSGSMASGTTRHLAAKYGLPATWSNFAYSLRPNRSPLKALIEMVVAREPSATLGQLGIYLAQLGRTDALQVLSKLG